MKLIEESLNVIIFDTVQLKFQQKTTNIQI